MDYTSRSRDRFRWAAVGVSGVLTTGVLVGTGAIAGQMAADLHAEQAARQRQRAEQYAAWQAQQAAYQAQLIQRGATTSEVVKQRPRRTRVITRYVTSSTAVTISAASGGSGTVRSGSHAAPPASQPVSHPAPAPHAAPPPPPPASSGS